MKPEVVTVEECYGLRSTILRPNQPKENWMFATDHDPRALHMAIKRGDNVIAIASLLPEIHNESPSHQWRLRAMVVIPECRGQHLGNQLLQALQAHARQTDSGIWCTARLNVEAFYLKNGFIRDSDVFEMNNMPHIRMNHSAAVRS